MINKIIKKKDLEDIVKKVFNDTEKGFKLIEYKTYFGILTIAVPETIK